MIIIYSFSKMKGKKANRLRRDEMTKVSNKKLVIVAIVLSLLTAALLYHYLKGIAGQRVAEGVSVIVAKTDIAPKTKITLEMVSEVKVPLEYIQPGAVKSMDKVIGIVVKEKIISGEQVSEGRLVYESKAVGFTGIIPRDKRAVTVAVTEVTGVAGFVKAGDYVDIVATFDTGAVGDNVSHVVMQNILVLASNRDTEMGAEATAIKESGKEVNKAGTVTIAVMPDEVARLTLAEEKGKIRLVLRPYLPTNPIAITEVVTPRDLVGNHVMLSNEQLARPETFSDERETVPVESPEPNYGNKGIQVIRGTKTENIAVH